MSKEFADSVVVAVGAEALLVDVCRDVEIWIPFTQIETESDLTSASDRGDDGNLVITDWLAKQEGID